MNKKKLAIAMAFMLTVSSVPTGGLSVMAAEDPFSDGQFVSEPAADIDMFSDAAPEEETVITPAEEVAEITAFTAGEEVIFEEEGAVTEASQNIILGEVNQITVDPNEGIDLGFSVEEAGRYAVKITSDQMIDYYLYYGDDLSVEDYGVDSGSFTVNLEEEDCNLCIEYFPWDEEEMTPAHITVEVFLTDTVLDYTETVYVEYGDEDIVLSVDADSSAGIVSYEWYVSEKNQYSWEALEWNDSSYTISNATCSEDYKCVVTDGNGIQWYADIEVIMDSGFWVDEELVNGKTMLVVPGESVALEVAAGVNIGELHYQWEYEYEEELEETTGTLNLLEIKDFGTYRCKVYDDYGNYEYATFSVYPDVELILDDYDQRHRVEYGNAYTLTVDAEMNDGSPLTFEWSQCVGNQEEDEEEWVELPEVTGSTYVIDSVTDIMYVSCHISSIYGENGPEEWIYFIVIIDTGVEVGEDTYVQVPSGTVKTLEAVVSAKEGITLSYQWYEQVDGEDIPIEGATDKFYTTDPITKRSCYRCEISDNYGQSYWISHEIAVERNWDIVNRFSTVAVDPGETARLVCEIKNPDNVNLTYEWLYLDADTGQLYKVENASSNILEVQNVHKSVEYRCVITDEAENLEEVYFTIQIDTGLIAEAVNSNVYVEAGETAVLEVKADVEEAYGPLTYNWEKYQMDPYYDYVKVETEENTPVLKVSDVQKREEYRCIVTDTLGNAHYVYFYIKIDTGLELNHALMNTTVRVQKGENANLKVYAHVDEGHVLSYQWYERNTSNGHIVPIQNAVSDSYLVENVTGVKRFYCEVRDEYDNLEEVWFDVGIDTGLKLDEVWEKVQVSFGGSAVLNVEATVQEEYQPLTYSWAKIYTLPNYIFEGVPGADTSQLQIDDVQQPCEYQCTVKDAMGNTEVKTFQVTMDTGLEIDWDNLKQTNFEVEDGGSVTLKMAGLIDEPYEIYYQWYDYRGNKIPGAASAEYTVTDVQGYDSYTCRISDEYGNTEGMRFDINGIDIDYGKTVSEVYADYGKTAEFEVYASVGAGVNLQYQWFTGDGKMIEGATGTTLKIDNVTKRESYYCKLYHEKDSFGMDVYFYANVDNGLKFMKDNQEKVVVNAGEDAVFTVKAAANSGELKYQWFELDQSSDSGRKPIEGANGNTFTVKNVTESRRYIVDVTDMYGSYISTVYTALPDTGFKLHMEDPMNQFVIVAPGTDVELKIDATTEHKDGIVYDWVEIDEQGYSKFVANGKDAASVTLKNVTETKYIASSASDIYDWENVFFWVIVPELENAKALTADAAVKAEFHGYGQVNYYKVTADEDAVYKFTADSKDDTYAYLLDDAGKLISNDDNSGEGDNFYIEKEMKKGEVCYLAVRYANMVYQRGSFNLILEKEVIQNYEIVYDANKGSGAPEVQVKEKDKALILSDTEPTRKGYKFLGWAAEADAKEALYKVGAEYTENRTITLYAVWEANTYKIKYYSNGGEGKMSASSATYGKSKTLRKNTFERKGYTFIGWNREKDGSGTAYTDEQKVKNLKSTQGATAKLYAQWKLTDYTITYDLNKGTNNSKNPASYTMKSDTITLEKPTRKGYTFKGWYTSEDWKTKVTEIESGSTGNVELYAKWSANTYKIKYYSNGGSGKMSDSSATYGKSKTLRTNTFERDGYTFAGWNTKKDGNGTAYADKQKVKNLTSTNKGSKKLYAQWTPINYTITYDLNKGTNSDKNPESYTVESSKITFEKPTRKGYTFKGWYTSEEWDTKITELEAGSQGDVKLYARWSANKYTVKYYSNDGTGTMKDTSATYGKKFNLRGNSFKRSGYVFAGWNTKKDGSGKSYSNKEEVKNLTSTNGKTVKLYAQWTKAK